MSKKLSGIYQIRNLINGKKYIGQTADLEKRKLKHFNALMGNYHYNEHLQNAYNKYGKENFVFEVLKYCRLFELTRYEQFFVDQEKQDDLYNIRIECVNSNLGTRCSDETREKLSIINRGKKHTKKSKNKISKALSGKNHPLYGKHRSKEAKEKISLNHVNVSGENNPRAKLTKKQVFEILDLYYNQNKNQVYIFKKYGVSRTTIGYICHGKTWKSCYKEFMENNS